MFLNVVFTLIKLLIEFGLNPAIDVVCLFIYIVCLFVYIDSVCLFVYIFYINNQLVPKA